ncbi:MAG: hypothetical protein ABI678_05330 [Kofleriaceae bacterium]
MKWALAGLLVSSVAMANPTPYDAGRVTIGMRVDDCVQYGENKDELGPQIFALFGF